MSGPLELYRTTVNLRGLGAGALIEIDPTDDGWAGDIRTKRVVPVEVKYETGGLWVNGVEVDDDPVSDLVDEPDQRGMSERGAAIFERDAAWRGGGRWMDAAGESGPRD